MLLRWGLFKNMVGDDNDMHKTTFSMPEKLFKRMMDYLETQYGETRGKMTIFLQDAIKEKLDKEKE